MFLRDAFVVHRRDDWVYIHLCAMYLSPTLLWYQHIARLMWGEKNSKVLTWHFLRENFPLAVFQLRAVRTMIKMFSPLFLAPWVLCLTQMNPACVTMSPALQCRWKTPTSWVRCILFPSPVLVFQLGPCRVYKVSPDMMLHYILA